MHEPFVVCVKQMEFLALPVGAATQPDNEFEFLGPDCLIQLFRWCQQQTEPTTVLFHNGGAYDTLMFLRELRGCLTEDDEMPLPLTNGNRLLSLTVGQVTFQNSLLHMYVSVVNI